MPAPLLPPDFARMPGVPLLCRLGLHHWPDTFARGATRARCLRCGKEKRRWWFW
jgi:hypothetical protein